MAVVTFTKHVQYDKHCDKYLHIFTSILFSKTSDTGAQIPIL